MKKIALAFCLRGLLAGGLGPLVLAIVYGILARQEILQTLTVREVCLGIVSLTGLAFMAGGLNIVYQIERLPLMVAIFIHGGVLYVSYLLTYLVNDWLDWGTAPVLVFTGIFVVGYLLIWAVIYSITKKNTERINEMLRKQQNDTESK